MAESIDPGVWQAFFRDGPDPAFAYAIEAEPRFVLVAANAAWRRATGLPEDAVGRSLSELMPAEAVSTVIDRLERVIQDGTPTSFDEELRFSGQARYWRTHIMPVRLDGEVRYLIGFAHDYTELRHADAALAASEAKFRRLVENASDIIYRLRLEPSVGFDYISPSIENITGYPPAAFYEDVMLMRRLMHPEDLPRLERSQAELRQEWGPVLARWLHKDGSFRWMEARSGLVRDGSGVPIAREGIARDVTEQKRRDEERALLDKRLQQTQKLESLGVLAGGIAHDFNNLLTGILGHVSLLRTDATNPADVLDHAQQIEVAATRAAELCRQMLAYSGKGRFAVRRLNVSELVRETAQLLRLSIAKTVELSLELDTLGAWTEGDATQLQQVIMNLVLNASEAYAGKPGRVAVRTGVLPLTRKELQNAHLAPELPDGAYVYIEVTDSGGGMSADTQARIFDPFFTTKFTGRGLGLSAVLGIVRGHHGSIQVQSELEQGTTFRILLPAVGAGSTEVATPPERVTGGKGLVLVVDDEDIVRGVTSRILQVLGYSVITARDGRECVELFAAANQAISAVLMDLTMPKLDGVAAFEELRRYAPNVPVILMSGFNEQDAIARFAASGLAGFLQKPFTAAELASKLGSALGLG